MRKPNNLNDSSSSGGESSKQNIEFFNNEKSMSLTNQQDKSYEAQNQLKFYIQSLEKKLANLRTEMKDSTVVNVSNNLIKKQDRFKEAILRNYGSNESIDSMKEIADANDIKQIYSNENKNNSNNLKEYFDKNSNMNFNSQDQKFMTPNLSPASTFEESSDDIHGSPDSEALKKSLHKSHCADSLFDKVKAVSATLAHSSSFTNHQNKSNSQISKFTPIINDSSNAERSLSEKDDNFCIKNPIPIRYSSTTTATTTTTGTSSSADSLSQHYMKIDKFESVENLDYKRLSLDEITKQKNSTTDSGINLGEPITNSLRLNNLENFNKKFALISKDSNMFKDNASSFRRANTLNINQISSPNSVQKTRSLLVVAHENQLSDITETCKEEMGLLMSFKDSQMVI